MALKFSLPISRLRYFTRFNYFRKLKQGPADFDEIRVHCPTEGDSQYPCTPKKVMCLPLRLCKKIVNGLWKALENFADHSRPEYIATEASTNPYLDQPITIGWCQPFGGHVSNPIDSPATDTPGLYISLRYPVMLTVWRHQMETFSTFTGPLCGEFTGDPVNSPHKGQWRGALMYYYICTLNKWLSKQSWGWWLETPSGPSWRHCNEVRRHTPRCSLNVQMWLNMFIWQDFLANG